MMGVSDIPDINLRLSEKWVSWQGKTYIHWLGSFPRKGGGHDVSPASWKWRQTELLALRVLKANQKQKVAAFDGLAIWGGGRWACTPRECLRHSWTPPLPRTRADAFTTRQDNLSILGTIAEWMNGSVCQWLGFLNQSCWHWATHENCPCNVGMSPPGHCTFLLILFCVLGLNLDPVHTNYMFYREPHPSLLAHSSFTGGWVEKTPDKAVHLEGYFPRILEQRRQKASL